MSRNTDVAGISTVVGLILVLGLIVSVAAVVKLTYIPDVKKQLEADHMDSVAGDIQAFRNQLEVDQAASTVTGVGYTASVSVEMGGGAIPGIDPSASSGTLSLDPSYGRLTVVAYDYISGARLDLGSATALGHLVYQSNNRYYADQNISYECGMITLSQPGGSVMLAPPSLAVSADPNVQGRPIVSFNAQRLNGTPQTFSSSGTGIISTWLIPGNTAYASTNVSNVTFTIVSDYPSQWYSYLSGMLATSGLAAGNYELSRPDARTVVLKISGIGNQSTGLYLVDTSFGTAMGYSYTSPGSPAVTPAPTPTPTPSQKPVANFSANVTTGASPLTVAFTDKSTGSPTSWKWNFGDGTANSTLQNPVHTYSNPGTYTVTLTVSNPYGSGALQKVGYITVYTAQFDRLVITASSHWTGTSGDTLTVTAYDQYGNVYAGYDGSVHFDSDIHGDSFTYFNNGHAYDYTASDSGRHVFTNVADLEYIGDMHTILVSDQHGNTATVDVNY